MQAGEETDILEKESTGPMDGYVWTSKGFKLDPNTTNITVLESVFGPEDMRETPLNITRSDGFECMDSDGNNPFAKGVVNQITNGHIQEEWEAFCEYKYVQAESICDLDAIPNKAIHFCLCEEGMCDGRVE